MKASRVLSVPFLAVLFRVSHGQLKIIGPRSLESQFPGTSGIVYGTTATFGAPYYGERVMGQLVYGESRGNNHCTEADYDIAPQKTVKNGQELVNVVLVRRGGCTFVTKVNVAQKKKAHAVVVVDKENSQLTSEQIQKIVMADDGFGSKVTIPSILLSRFDGEKLIEAVRKEPVIVELAWDIPQGEVVIADFWMSSGSRESAEFLERFQDSAETLKYHLQFTPHFHIFSLPPGSGYNHLCAASIESCGLCKPADGKYCAPDPDGPGPITGGEVANEDLRRLCIWKVTARRKSDKGAQYSQGFWDYVVQFFHDCSLKSNKEDRRFGYKCSVNVMKKVGISVSKVQKCVSQNYAGYLDEQIEKVAWSPQALRLNGWRYSGPLDPETVLKAVCSGYTTPPQECTSLMTIYSGSSSGWSSALSGLPSLLMVLGCTMSCLGVLFFLYKRHVTMSMRKALREEVMLEVQTQMADYVPMEDKGAPNRPALSF